MKKDSFLLAGAHQRLSIIDQSVKSNQPLFSFCGNYFLIFNGEIYNYKELEGYVNERHSASLGDSEFY